MSDPVSDDAIEGVAPYPEIPIADAGDTRFLDLRGLPSAVLIGGAGIDYARAVVATEEPIANHVWIVPAEVAAAWASLTPIAATFIGAQMSDTHRVLGHDLLHAPGYTWRPDEMAQLAAAGITVALDATVVGSERCVTLAEVVAGFNQPRPAGMRRPVLDAVRHGFNLCIGPGAHVTVTEIGRYAFVDFRPASLASLDRGDAFYDVAHALGELGGTADTVVWLVAPWLLARWEPWAPVLYRLRELVALRPRARHALAVYGDGGDEERIDELVELGLVPLRETIRVIDAGTTFEIKPVTALRDAVLWRAAVNATIVAG